MGNTNAGPGFFHVVAIDFDGTLADQDGPSSDVLAAVRETRSCGRKVVLVTGRILSELRRVFPGVDREVDLIVAENGAAVSLDGIDRMLSTCVPHELEAAIRARGVHVQRGQALLDCQAVDEPEILAALRELGLECQLVRNRAALMVLPPGVSKGSGLYEGLGYLGISHHNTLAVGDAENDHSLIDSAEVGVAVANAVDALKAHADIVLDSPDGAGVAELLRGPIVTGQRRVHPRRWQIELGSAPDGRPVTVPASQINMMITGAPRRGKSYVAGLVVERLIGLRYAVLVLDPEGDHVALGRLRGVLVVGGEHRLPAPDELAALIAHRFSSVVIDLSGSSSADRNQYLRLVPAAIERQRARTGLPHWVVIDEAHEPLGRDGVRGFLEPASTGYCLVTYRPRDIRAEALSAIDVIIALPGGVDLQPTVDLVAEGGGISRSTADQLVAAAGPGHAILVERSQPGHGVVFAIGPRDTSHLRHWHKYSTGKLSRERHFHFRRDWDTATGRTAGSIEDLDRELHSCSDSVILHHCSHSDFSRWVSEVLGDPPLAGAFSEIEIEVAAGATSVSRAREQLLRAIEQRYPEQPDTQAGAAAPPV